MIVAVYDVVKLGVAAAMGLMAAESAMHAGVRSPLAAFKAVDAQHVATVIVEEHVGENNNKATASRSAVDAPDDGEGAVHVHREAASGRAAERRWQHHVAAAAAAAADRAPNDRLPRSRHGAGPRSRIPIDKHSPTTILSIHPFPVRHVKPAAGPLIIEI